MNAAEAAEAFGIKYSPGLHLSHVAWCVPTRLPTLTSTHTVGNWEYHENLLTKVLRRIDSHGRPQHLELISLLCFDKSSGADFRLTIQTHKEAHLSSPPSPLLIINKLGRLVFSLLTSIAFLVNLTANMEEAAMPGV